MGGQHHMVEVFHALGCANLHTLLVAGNAQHGGVQTFVDDGLCDGLHIVLGTPCHREPRWAVVDLQQAVVVTKPHHGGHRKLQHLGGWATPDAAEHGQQIALAKCGTKVVFV